MNRKRIFISLFSIMILIIFISSLSINAFEHENCKNINSIGGTIPLVHGEKSVTFKLADNEFVKDKCYLDLDLQLDTKQKDSDYNLFIIINKKNVKEINLSNLKNERRNIKIDIPKEYFKQGYNRLEINIKSIDKNRKINNTDIINIYGESFIHIEL